MISVHAGSDSPTSLSLLLLLLLSCTLSWPRRGPAGGRPRDGGEGGAQLTCGGSSVSQDRFDLHRVTIAATISPVAISRRWLISSFKSSHPRLTATSGLTNA